jgi:hypothetical protein
MVFSTAKFAKDLIWRLKMEKKNFKKEKVSKNHYSGPFHDKQ